MKGNGRAPPNAKQYRFFKANKRNVSIANGFFGMFARYGKLFRLPIAIRHWEMNLDPIWNWNETHTLLTVVFALPRSVIPRMARFRGADPLTSFQVFLDNGHLRYVWITDSTERKLLEKLVYNVIFYSTTYSDGQHH